MDAPVVLDKSFLQASGTSEIFALCDDENVLMPEALFMEIVCAEKRVRNACFKKFPDRDNPVELIDHVGSFLRYEGESGKPVTPIFEHRRKIVFSFNRRLREGTFSLTKDQEEVIAEWEKELAEEVAHHKGCCAVVDGWFPDLRGYKPGSDEGLIEDLRHAVASDGKMIRDIYGTIRKDFYPPTACIDKNWAFFRWMQVHLLAALEFVRRYGPRNANIEAMRLENDVVDLQYEITGVLAGALATRDKAIGATFRLLRPNGRLLE